MILRAMNTERENNRMDQVLLDIFTSYAKQDQILPITNRPFLNKRLSLFLYSRYGWSLPIFFFFFFFFFFFSNSESKIAANVAYYKLNDFEFYMRMLGYVVCRDRL